MNEPAGNGMAAWGITVNQIGYLPDAHKTFICAGEGGAFEIVREADGQAVYHGETGPPLYDEASGITVSRGHFTACSEEGSYFVRLNGETSASFAIGHNPYAELHSGLLKSFYYFRCGMELEEPFAGPWKHAACHTAEGIVYGEPDRKQDSSGGWHDAGDYGKYTGPGAKAAADLLLAYEFAPQAFQRPIPLPETDGLAPDVLHECRYELEWLLKMQDERTGGAFHKLTTKQFPALDVMPEDDRAELYFMPVSAAATGCFAGVMALAARVYRPYDEAFASRCLAAAERAWEWLERHPAAPENPGFKNPADVATGEYGDPVDLDERYWATGELFRTTGKRPIMKRSGSWRRNLFRNTNWAGRIWAATVRSPTCSAKKQRLTVRSALRWRPVCLRRPKGWPGAAPRTVI